jgi:hypothetical protein
MKTCNRPGCARPARARSMCASHYAVWLRNAKKKGLKKPVEHPEKRVLKAMPGTLAEIVEKDGRIHSWVRRIVKNLHDSGKIHISGHQPPKDKAGSRWLPIFSRGKGIDAQVTPEQKVAHMLDRRRRLYEKNKGKKYRPEFTRDPLLGAMFGARP